MTGSSETNRNGETEKDRVGRNPGPLWASTRAERVNDRATQAIVAGVESRLDDGAPSMFSTSKVRKALYLFWISVSNHVFAVRIRLLLSIAISPGHLPQR